MGVATRYVFSMWEKWKTDNLVEDPNNVAHSGEGNYRPQGQCGPLSLTSITIPASALLFKTNFLFQLMLPELPPMR